MLLWTSKAKDGGFASGVLMPLAALMGLVLIVLFGIVFWIAHRQDVISAERERQLAVAAMDLGSRNLSKIAFDYGNWQDAVEKIIARRDDGWIDNQIGLQTYRSYGITMVFVLEPDDRTSYAMINGRRSELDIGGYVTKGIESLVAEVRNNRIDTSVAGLVVADGNPAFVAVSPIMLPGARSSTSRSTLLVLVNPITPGQLEEFGRTYLLPKLHIEAIRPGSAGGYDRTPVSARDGSLIGWLAWSGARPGSDLLRALLPVLVLLSLGLGLSSWLVFRHASHAADRIRTSEAKAMHDALTGLPNRLLLFDRLDRIVLGMQRRVDYVAVLYIDLDGFKAVNDAHGHEGGDALLRQVAQRLRESLRDGDTVARLGGDEFAVLCTHIASREAAGTVAAKLIIEMAQPFELALSTGVVTTRISASIGVAVAPPFGGGSADLIRKADIALYRAKAAGKHTWLAYTGADDEGVTLRELQKNA